MVGYSCTYSIMLTLTTDLQIVLLCMFNLSTTLFIKKRECTMNSCLEYQVFRLTIANWCISWFIHTYRALGSICWQDWVAMVTLSQVCGTYSGTGIQVVPKSWYKPSVLIKQIIFLTYCHCSVTAPVIC